LHIARFADIPAEDDRTPSNTFRGSFCTTSVRKEPQLLSVLGVCQNLSLGGGGVPLATGVLLLAPQTFAVSWLRLRRATQGARGIPTPPYRLRFRPSAGRFQLRRSPLAL